MTRDDSSNAPDPWETLTHDAPDPFVLPPGWHGGLCPVHGCYFVEGCQNCPPTGHPLHEGPALRRAWALGRDAAA